MPSQIKVDEIKNVAGQYEIKTNTFKGQTTAGSIAVQGEGTNTTNLQQGVCKCWALISADGASILDSFNVSTIDDDGTGDGGIHFTTDMSSANYVIQLTADDGAAGSSVNAIEVTKDTPTSGSFDYENNYVNSASDNRTAFNVIRHIAVLGDLS